MEINYPKETRRKIGELGEWLGAGSINAFGRQFAGKDTNLVPLSTAFRTPIIGGGDILRNIEIPDDIQKIMDSGQLIPSDAYEAIVLPYLSQPDFEGRPLLLSSVGRMKGEEVGVMQATTAAGHAIKLAVDFQITRDESHKRLNSSPSRNRADDTTDGLNQRLDFFDEYTAPVIDRYQSEGLLITIDAMPETDIVFRSFVHIAHDRATGRG